VTDPTQPPRSRGRHSQTDAGGDASRPASELLASWAGSAADTLQLAEDGGDPMRPRRRRYAPETDAGGVQVLAPRGAVDVADVEITGLAAAGIADVGLAAAGLDLSAFGIDRPVAPRRPVTPKAWPGVDGSSATIDPAPRTAEMRVVPPAVPHLSDEGRAARRPGLDRRLAPAPRAAVEATTADRVAADRFADAATDPGWLSGRSRPLPGAVPAPAPALDEDQDEAPATAVGSLASLFTDPPPAGVHAPEGPLTEPATEVHVAVDGEFDDEFDDEDDAQDWQPLSDRHRTDGADGADDDEQQLDSDADADAHAFDLTGPLSMADHTGGLEVVVADEHDDEDDHVLDGGSGGGGRGRRGGRGGGSGAPRERRRPITVLLSLVVLAAVVAGVFFGGKALYNTINPVAEDYSGGGTGSVDVRVNDGDSLRAIAGTLVGADVIASAGPFEDAAKANPAATSIQPGVYTLRSQMSGKAALDLLLDPASRQLTKVTVPEGLTVTQVLQRLSDQAGLPLADLQAAAADPAALGLPAYANGLPEGFLFPATYDIEPGQTPVQILSQMVAGTVQVLDSLQVPEADRLSVITEASIVQAEAGSIEDMGKVARVLDNRLADGMPLQLDTTVNYANGKGGITTTSEDRANPSPYNTYVHAGLPPGAIGNPGEEAIRAVLNPTPGDWRFFVVVDPDTGETRFAVTAAEHAQNVLLFQQWLQDNPGN
jgi:UPF0755 protein